MHQLQKLELDNNAIGSAAAQHLAQGNWPELDFLGLANNFLDSPAIAHLVKGQWPKLQRLDLDGNFIGSKGLEHVAESDWDQLHTLYLDVSLDNDATWALLGLGGEPKACSCDVHEEYVHQASRLYYLRESEFPWPQLPSLHHVNLRRRARSGPVRSKGSVM